MAKAVLVLGAGLVVAPLVEYLSKKGFKVTLASRTVAKAEEICKGLVNTTPIALNVEVDADLEKLDELVPNFDAVVSMLPYIFHAVAAKIAIKHSKHFLTTSYTSDALKAFQTEAVAKGVVMINECGVDPGSDHCSAMRVIDDIRKRGGKLTSFTSYCGGLPAPDANDNPYGYKFSWAPRGVLLATRNTAAFLEHGKRVEYTNMDVLTKTDRIVIDGVGELEGLANRDSTTYVDVYSVDGIQTLRRGTYRYNGWCDIVSSWSKLGLLDLVEDAELPGKTYAEMMAKAVGASSPADAKNATAAKLGVAEDSQVIKAMEWLGLFSETETVPARNKLHMPTCLDALAAVMQEKMVYKDGERDMIVMRHEFIAEFAERKEREHLSSQAVYYGVPHGQTAMCRTVSWPVAIATRLVLEGKFTIPGLSIPVIPELYVPILDELAEMGYSFTEKVEKVEPLE